MCEERPTSNKTDLDILNAKTLLGTALQCTLLSIAWYLLYIQVPRVNGAIGAVIGLVSLIGCIPIIVCGTRLKTVIGLIIVALEIGLLLLFFFSLIAWPFFNGYHGHFI